MYNNPSEGFGPSDAHELYIDLQKILLAANGSKESLIATKYAVALAKMFKAKLRVLFIQDELADTAETDRGLAMAKAYAQRNGVAFEGTIERGNAVKKVVESAHEFFPDVIILGNSAKSGVRRAIGNAVSAVMKGTDVPVLVVRDT